MHSTTARAVALALWLGAMILCASIALGQEPDRRGEVSLKQPEYRGTRANAPIPPAMHIRNEGGSDGAGLCVIASLTINGAYQRVADLGEGKQSALWKAAKKRPGGYSPGKLEALLKDVMPDEKWVSSYGQDPGVLDDLSASGRPIGVTMNTGALYGYRPIHHMVSLIHYKTGELACVVDNNDPGVYHWMPAKEFLSRWYDGGAGWAFAWSKLPVTVRTAIMSLLVLAGALLLLAAAVLLLVPIALGREVG